MDLLLHPTTKKHLELLYKRVPNSVIINGPKGSGKRTLALQISNHYIGRLINNANYLEISPTTKSLGIDDIRSITSFLSKKSLSGGRIKRMIIIDQAITMTIEAQNALLKTLEEPPNDTIIIIISDDINRLRPTIKSRSHIFNVLPVTLSHTQKYFNNLSSDQVTAAFHMANGRAGFISTILDPENEGVYNSSIVEAKELLKMPVYKRLTLIDAYTKDPTRLDDLLNSLESISLMGLRLSAQKADKPSTSKFLKINDAIFNARLSLGYNPNSKLMLTNLLLNI